MKASIYTTTPVDNSNQALVHTTAETATAVPQSDQKEETTAALDNDEIATTGIVVNYFSIDFSN